MQKADKTFRKCKELLLPGMRRKQRAQIKHTEEGEKIFPTFFLSDFFWVLWLQPFWGGNHVICCRHLTKVQFSSPCLAAPLPLAGTGGNWVSPARCRLDLAVHTQQPFCLQPSKSPTETWCNSSCASSLYSLHLGHIPALQQKISLLQDTHLQNRSHQNVKFISASSPPKLLNTVRRQNNKFSTVSSWNYACH